MLRVPVEKIEALCNQIRIALQSNTLPARSLASITGKLISMSLALGPVTRLMTRGLYASINMRNSWCQNLTMSPEAIKELRFWSEQINSFNGQNIWHSPSAIRVVYSDASSSGYGGYLVEHGCHIAHGQWLPNEKTQSSTWRELKVVHEVLESLTGKLANQRIHWFTDNQNVVRILSIGSRNPLLQQVALAIFNISIAHHCRIEPEWRQTNKLTSLAV